MSVATKKKNGIGVLMATWTIGVVGAVGTGLQNFMAFLSFLMDIGRIGPQLAQGLAITLGGAVSGLVNLWMNVNLLEAFFKRFTGEKKLPNLSKWAWARLWLGSLIFLGTGILFGMTAFAFGGVGILASLGVASGLFVALIMMIQELETWWESFDEIDEKSSFKEALVKWWQGLTKAKAIGIVISLGNVLALSLLFAMGLTTFLTSVGVALFPALVASIVVAFTAGAFTEFYFYNTFLANFCEKLFYKKDADKAGDEEGKWSQFLQLPWYGKLSGVLAVSINAVVNAILCYAGVILFNSLLASAGMSVLPLAAIITASVFCGLASFILGSDFWIKVLVPKTNYQPVSTEEDNPTPQAQALHKELSPAQASVPAAKQVVKTSAKLAATQETSNQEADTDPLLNPAAPLTSTW